MKILSPKNLEIRISEFLENLRKKNKFEYFPAVRGVTKEGERLNLGFSCYALKCSYILNLLSDDDLKIYLSKIPDETLYAYNVYQIEGIGRNLFTSIEGDEDTIMGLPVKKIKEYISSL